MFQEDKDASVTSNFKTGAHTFFVILEELSREHRQLKYQNAIFHNETNFTFFATSGMADHFLNCGIFVHHQLLLQLSLHKKAKLPLTMWQKNPSCSIIKIFKQAHLHYCHL